MLCMSATPIPRSLSLTLFGDLDLSVIDEMPPNRQFVKTYAVDDNMRARVYNFVKKELDVGRQAYIVCPLVDPTDKIEARAVNDFIKLLLEEELRGYTAAAIHGRSKDKDRIMTDFSAGKIQVLISTTVVEVGVNVPNATVMIIENTERFGLSQLHQLRGRVGRGSHQSYCIMFNQSAGELAGKRMDIMTKTNDGFVIAKTDMELRGAGEFFGTRQHGLPELKIANIFTDEPVLKTASSAAYETLKNDAGLLRDEHKPLREQVRKFFSGEIIFN